MSAAPQMTISPEEYLAAERASATKHEYIDGRVYAMAGASEAHNLISGNIYASLHAQLRRRPCRAYMSDLRVKVSEMGAYVYPDVVAVCGERRFDDVQKDTLLNPNIVFEVSSPSTERYDKESKFMQYSALTSLQEYLLVAQNRRLIVHTTRQVDSWTTRIFSSNDDILTLTSIGCEIRMSDVYEGVDF